MDTQRNDKLKYLLDRLDDGEIDPAIELLLEKSQPPVDEQTSQSTLEPVSYKNNGRVMLITIFSTLIVIFAGLVMGRFNSNLYYMIPTFAGISVIIILLRKKRLYKSAV